MSSPPPGAGSPGGPKSMIRGFFNTVAPDYDAGPGVFAHFGQRLADAAGIESGQRVLDVASGRGAVLFPAAGRAGAAGEVIGIDLAEEMARVANAEAERRGVAARVKVMDAEALDFPDASFDCVLCGFGVMFFPDQARALAEMRRVLKPGGRLAVSTWRVSQAEEMSAVTAQLGFGSGSPPGWIDKADVLEHLLAQNGFAGVRVNTDSKEFRYADIGEYWELARGTGLRGTLDKLDAVGKLRVQEAFAERVKAHRRADGLYLAATALIGVAQR
jgi:ubiquinone/menaquinone biosynthesis C-methylase UbiE